jgi:hypothetical protein
MKRRFPYPSIIAALSLALLLSTTAGGQQSDPEAADSAAVDTTVIDTTTIVEDVHPEDIAESGFEVNVTGYVRVNAFYDVKGLANTESFKPIEIPVGDEATDIYNGLYIGARQSRVGIESIAITSIGRLRTYIEGDFVGPNNTLSFRLRHAYGHMNYWTLGHTWSTVVDLGALPKTVDLEGPNSAVLVRQGLVRYERRFKDHYVAALGLENPKTEVTDVTEGDYTDVRQTDFDVTTRLRYGHNRGHAQLAGVFRVITFKDGNNENQSVLGGGGLVSARYDTHHGGMILVQGIVGRGIARYINGLGGSGYDGIMFDGRLELIDVVGWYAAYQWNWTSSVHTSFVAGSTQLLNTGQLPGDAYHKGHYGSVDTFWGIMSNYEVGFGVTVGRRINNDGQSGDAQRFGFIGKFQF